MEKIPFFRLSLPAVDNSMLYFFFLLCWNPFYNVFFFIFTSSLGRVYVLRVSYPFKALQLSSITGPKVIKLFSCSSQLSIKFEKKILKKKWLIFGSDKPRMLFFPLISVKMPTIVGILTFMRWKNFTLRWVEHEKSFINSGPGFDSP